MAAASSLVEKSELTVRPGMEDAFLAALVDRGRPLLNGVDGVVSVRIGRGVENPGKFVLLVEWTSLDAHKAYGAAPAGRWSTSNSSERRPATVTAAGRFDWLSPSDGGVESSARIPAGR